MQIYPMFVSVQADSPTPYVQGKDYRYPLFGDFQLQDLDFDPQDCDPDSDFGFDSNQD
jgi:hypothetical protein